MLTRQQRALVRGKYGGRCAYCGRILPEKGWQADHRVSLYRQDIPRYRDVSGVDDYEPSCRRCNGWKSTYSVEEFREEISAQIARLRAASAGFRLAEDFGTVQATGTRVRFYFETVYARPAGEEPAT